MSDSGMTEAEMLQSRLAFDDITEMLARADRSPASNPTVDDWESEIFEWSTVRKAYALIELIRGAARIGHGPGWPIGGRSS